MVSKRWGEILEKENLGGVIMKDLERESILLIILSKLTKIIIITRKYQGD